MTLFGIIIELKLWLFTKAPLPMFVTSLINLITPLPSLYVLETIIGNVSVSGITIFSSKVVYHISSLGIPSFFFDRNIS